MHSFLCIQPLCLSQGTASSLHSDFRLVLRPSFFRASSLQVYLKAQFLQGFQPSGLSQGTASAHGGISASLPVASTDSARPCAGLRRFPFFNLSVRNEALLQVKVRRRGSDMKYVAQVLAVGTECDIGRPACVCCTTCKLCSVGSLIKHSFKACSGNQSGTPCWSGFVSLLWPSPASDMKIRCPRLFSLLSTHALTHQSSAAYADMGWHVDRAAV